MRGHCVDSLEDSVVVRVDFTLRGDPEPPSPKFPGASGMRAAGHGDLDASTTDAVWAPQRAA